MDTIDPDNSFSPTKLLQVLFIFLLFHIAFTAVVDSVSSYTFIVEEFRSVERQVHGTEDKQFSTVFFEGSTLLRTISTWPLHHFTIEDPSAKYAVSEFSVPWFIMLLNSLCNAILMLLLCNLLALIFLKRDSNIRSLLQGRGSKEAHKRIATLSLASNDPGVFRTAKYLKHLEGYRYGPILVVGILHYAIVHVVNIFSVATRIGGGPPLEIVAFLRFPMTPLIVDASFWEATQASARAQAIVSISNSLLWGLMLTIFYTIAKSLSGHK